MNNKISRNIIIPDSLGGMRLDQALANLLPEFSRTELQDWIKQGYIKLDGNEVKPRYRVIGQENISLEVTKQPNVTFEPEAIDIHPIYEDEAVLVLNKPAGLVVHPGAGNQKHTLLNALLYHYPELANLPRAGILHRLDKDTSGIMVVAKTPHALKHLSKQLKARSLKRIYQAVVMGLLTSGGTVDEPIGRHPIQRLRMAVNEEGKEAITHYRIIEKFRAHTRIKVQLETGRTHQIRVHMAHVRHPILGDPVYGGRLQLPKGATQPLIEMLRRFKRQALHAYELAFIHPDTDKEMTFKAELPTDFEELIKVLKIDATSEN